MLKEYQNIQVENISLDPEPLKHHGLNRRCSQSEN